MRLLLNALLPPTLALEREREDERKKRGTKEFYNAKTKRRGMKKTKQLIEEQEEERT